MEETPEVSRTALSLLPVKAQTERDEMSAQAARISAEYEVNKHKRTRTESRRVLKEMYHEEAPSRPSETVGPRHSIRQHILAMSLFPNIYNKKSVMTYS